MQRGVRGPRTPEFLRSTWRIVFIVDGLYLRLHPLMQDSADQNASSFGPVEHNVLAVLHAVQTAAYLVAGTAQSWILGNKMATVVDLVEITSSLRLSPSAKSVSNDVV